MTKFGVVITQRSTGERWTHSTWDKLEQEAKMISTGHFTVARNTLKEMGWSGAMIFVYEMWRYGSRISHYEYQAWIKWINKNITL